ncbi:MAG: two-component sensor histidine kinase [Rhodoferax sp.]|uniref:ATP-binding protein n=1 Tax=Rhodoferax sp. TaxID=50421 RepID=UPI001844FEF1|nr:ATP-binding protein [Rhodoferax sp.]NMM12367.1 two-component sensor histidine kinase [Rhodoferax sp.]NMM18766.1 two-component sensor histidine kinase [Rhodoferax sp.]
MSSLTPHSLRTRLLGWLLVAISVTAVAQASIAYLTARAEADDIFDYHMQQMAMSLRSALPLNADGAAIDAPRIGENADFVVQVWTANGLRVFQSAARAALPDRAVLGFSNLKVQGTTYRMFSMLSKSQTIQIAQDMAARRQMASTLALRTIAPIAVMAPLLMLVAWWAVSASLASVSRVRRQVAARQADDLTEVSEAGLPDEIQPLVHELNLLFGRVRQAFDAQKSFVGDAAHELRSPLAALKLQAQSLQRATDDATRQVAIGRLTAGIDRATRLVEQLLVLARQQANAATGSKPQPVALSDMARLAIADTAPSAQARQIDLGLSLADKGEIAGHAPALQILLRNLLDNAVKYTPPGGTVDVEVRRVGDRLVLTVDDSGPGIPEPDRERVLDRFYRVAGTETTGSGLGLAIVKSIAELHGARLSLAHSARLGGLRVEVNFPASP